MEVLKGIQITASISVIIAAIYYMFRPGNQYEKAFNAFH